MVRGRSLVLRKNLLTTKHTESTKEGADPHIAEEQASHWRHRLEHEGGVALVDERQRPDLIRASLAVQKSHRQLCGYLGVICIALIPRQMWNTGGKLVPEKSNLYARRSLDNASNEPECDGNHPVPFPSATLQK